MVDILALSLSHGLLLLAAWRLLSRPELDVELRAEPSESPDPAAPGTALVPRRGRAVMKVVRGADGESPAGGGQGE